MCSSDLGCGTVAFESIRHGKNFWGCETEWLLDVLEQLLDFYYIAPAKTESLRAILDEKLSDTGKPKLK